jgi:hypothetical protein
MTFYGFSIFFPVDPSLFMAPKRKGLVNIILSEIKGWVHEKQNNSRVG